MALKLWNTLTRREEEIDKKSINLYTCGPTVYDYAHIGNLRSYIAADILRRTLELNAASVHWVMNITDVDDKTIRRTIEKYGIHATLENLREFTTGYFEIFKQNLADVNIPETKIEFIRVSDVIPQIIEFVKALMGKGYAYATEDGVYFSIEKYQKDFGDYGELAGESFLAGKKIGARVKVDDYEKENLSDFALWKARGPEDGNIFWNDPSGQLPDGRPGWHIECSVINKIGFKGEATDIHTGGVDLIFPHHTNEIAQSQALLGKGNFVKHWFHSEHLMVSGRKMAKREGNFFTLEDLKANYPNAGSAFRYLSLQTHYKNQMNFIEGSLVGASNAILRTAAYPVGNKVNERAVAHFREALNSDLNTSESLAVASQDQPDASGFFEILGIQREDRGPIPTDQLSHGTQALLALREEAKAKKDFAKADEYRKQAEEGEKAELRDTPQGPELWRK